MVLRRHVLFLKTGVWILGLTPLGWAVYRFFLGDGFGANPIAELQLWGGLTSLTALLCAVSVTPVRRLTGWNGLQKVRRLIGLFAFFYVALHFLIWIGVDQFFAWEYIVEDIAERPYILIGFSAFILLIPLAITSTRGWIRRLGRSWVRLHRLVYVAALFGIIHYYWVTKADDRWPTFALIVWAVAMALRTAWWLRRLRSVTRARGATAGAGAAA